MRPLLVLALLAAPALAQVVGETQDFGVAPTGELRLREHAAPTPLEIPGARTIGTAELRRLLSAPLGSPAGAQRPLLFDVISEERHASLPGAVWLPGAGLGESFDDEVQKRLARTLAQGSGGDRARSMVFFCANARCWLSYNAALRAVRLGYSGVRWYRGGIDAWGRSGGALVEPKLVWRD
ncbi:MAG TPA: rhodanese-like domain-containing protein [Burkholderiales bacterium]|nr:rhodanese-like domain-containing protein [Burkholderiales bacterium]